MGKSDQRLARPDISVFPNPADAGQEPQCRGRQEWRGATEPWAAIAAAISSATQQPFRCDRRRALGGGCIHTATVLSDGQRSFFVKTNTAARAAMFAQEAEGLRELAGVRAVRVPGPVCTGTAGPFAYLVLEHLDLHTGGDLCQRRLGVELARLHRHTATRYGFRMDNTIGATPQPNGPAEDWIVFWGERRLRFQLRRAAAGGHDGDLQRLGERLVARLPKFFADYRPPASLLHGDLWGGNAGCLDDGTPVLFDPAVYYGDREVDLALTELFGGFTPGFYAAYRAAWPLDAGYGVRKTLYNLYHVLNHLNLFGGGYGGQAERMMRLLLAEAG